MSTGRVLIFVCQYILSDRASKMGSVSFPDKSTNKKPSFAYLSVVPVYFVITYQMFQEAPRAC